MAQIGTCWNQTSWAVPAWAANTWAGTVVPVTPTEPAGGGRRIYDPDDHKRRKYRDLTRRERDDIDRMFRDRVAPRYVQPTPPPVVVTKRTTPIVIPAPLPVPGFAAPVDRVQAAKHFLALDALEGLFDRIEPLPRPVVADHRAALANAERLRLEMEQRRADAQRAWELAEQERMEAERQADEDEMMMVLLCVHEADL